MSWEDGFRDSPYHRFLGLEFALNDGVAEVRMPFREELVSDPDEVLQLDRCSCGRR